MSDVMNMDACVALADLVPRAGGKQLEIGYMDEGATRSSEARWYAQFYTRGIRLWCDEQPSPQEAADGLALKILLGGKCDACKLTVAVRLQSGDVVSKTAIGNVLNRKRNECIWYRDGDAWVQGCTGKRRVTRD